MPLAEWCQRHGTTIRNVLAESMEAHRVRRRRIACGAEIADAGGKGSMNGVAANLGS